MVALVNLAAMTVFLWHQTVLAAAALAALRSGPVPGLLTPPMDAAWMAQRLAWLPVLAALLLLVRLAGSVRRTAPGTAAPTEAPTAALTVVPPAALTVVPRRKGR
ncbi:hypothetical protein ACFOWE_17755 [Planomonospora corallina]|uniref:Acyltransferase n=1 Tax=Planomonospora corallina TaxID=1806052 RepID=A0ABV8I7G9_9ACTN